MNSAFNHPVRKEAIDYELITFSSFINSSIKIANFPIDFQLNFSNKCVRERE